MTSTAAIRKNTSSRQRANQNKHRSTDIGHIDGPEVVIIGAHESHDGQSHMAVRNVMWFATAEERAMLSGRRYFEMKVDGVTLYGAEYVSHLD